MHIEVSKKALYVSVMSVHLKVTTILLSPSGDWYAPKDFKIRLLGKYFTEHRILSYPYREKKGGIGIFSSSKLQNVD